MSDAQAGRGDDPARDSLVEMIERTVPATPFDWTGERLVTSIGGQIEVEHLHRYFFAREFCRGLDVLDVASGEGYGAALLAQVARSATGVEVAAAVVGHAQASYIRPNLRFIEGDARAIPVEDATMDVVVSFETIEHIAEHDTFLTEAKRDAAARGAADHVVARPCRLFRPRHPGQPVPCAGAGETGVR